MKRENLIDRIRFYVWCNMHWEEKLRFRLPVKLMLTNSCFIVEFRAPKYWFIPLGFTYRLALDCYSKDIKSPTEEQLYDIPF